nr:hypothetical protein [Thermoleophilum album]
MREVGDERIDRLGARRRVLEALTSVSFDQAQADGVERGAHGADLRDDIPGRTAVVDHPRNSMH